MIELIDHSPIWIVRYSSGLTIEDYRDYLDEFRSLSKPGQRLALIADFTYYNPIGASAALRGKIAETLEGQMSFFEERMLCEVRVCSNPIMRGIITVFDYMTNLPWPCSNVSSGHVAELWARAQLAKAGIAAPTSEVWNSPRWKKQA